MRCGLRSAWLCLAGVVRFLLTEIAKMDVFVQIVLRNYRFLQTLVGMLEYTVRMHVGTQF